MSAADNRQTYVEIGVTEMLFKVMVSRPVAPFVEDIKRLTGEEINAKNSTGRTMLHEAVILGKVDWAKELLEAGANEMVKDGDSKTALQLAEEMLGKHAGKKERKDLCHMLDRPSLGSGSCGSSVDVCASIGTRRLTSNVEESPKNSLEGVKGEVNLVKNAQEDMREGLDAMKKSLEGVKAEVNSVKNSQEEIKEGLDTVKKSLEGVKGEVNSVKDGLDAVKNAQEEMKDGLDAVKSSLEGVKGEVDKFKTQIQNIEMKVDAVIPMMISLHKESFKEFYIGGMMGKTKVIPSNDENKSRMRKLYEKMYDEDSILSTILQFIRLQSVEVHVDFESSWIGGMKPTFIDHDYIERSGGGFDVFADFEERKAYVAGKHDSDEIIIPRLALALSQLCVLLAFNNKGLPYSKEGGRERESYKEILEEAERKKGELDGWIRVYALDRRMTPIGKEIYLHAMVPAIIARYGSSEGRSTLNNQLPSLLEYLEKHVMTALRGAETMKRIAAEFVTRL